MTAENSDRMRGALIVAAVALLAMVWLDAFMRRPIPFEARNTSPGFGWSWDFSYEGAMQEPHLTPDAPINRAPAPAADLLLLSIDRPVVIAGLAITYRGMTESGRLRLETRVPALDAEYAYPRELSPAEARRGFALFDQRFVLLAHSPSLLRLRHVPQ